MGLQPISDRRLRHAAQATGLPVYRAMRHSNHLWFGWVAKGSGHWHVAIDPATWEWEYRDRCGFSSCSEGKHGPRVEPDQEIVDAQAQLDATRVERRAQAERESDEFVAIWKAETERWLNREA